MSTDGFYDTPDTAGRLVRICLACLTLLWMLLIFCMSSAVQDESDAQSGVICEFLCRTFVEGYEGLPPAQQLQMQERFSFPVRKGAHLTEYLILGVLLTLTEAAYRTKESGDSDGKKKNLEAKTVRILHAPLGNDAGPDRKDLSRATGVNDTKPDREDSTGAAGVNNAEPDREDLAKTVRKKHPWTALLKKPAFLVGVLYAVSDEIHQVFVPGRAGQPRDVLIDSVGVVIGICIVQRIQPRGLFLRSSAKGKKTEGWNGEK